MAKSRKTKAEFPSHEAIADFVRQSDEQVSRREITEAFNLDMNQRSELRDVLADMCAAGLIEKGRRRTYRARLSLPNVAVLEVTGTDDNGEVLARPLNMRDQADAPLIHIPPEKRNRRALGPGDRLLARLTPISGGEYRGKIIRRITEAPLSVLGIVEIVRGEMRVRPTERGARHDFIVATGEAAGAGPGDLVRVDVMEGKRLGLRKAKVVERLEKEVKSFSLIALHDHEIPIDLAPEAVAQAKAAGPAPADGRTDLRDIPLVTIDGADARDFDDAVWAEADAHEKNPGGWHLLVAIADVSWYVRAGDALDRSAYERGNSVYFPDRVVPMLPEALSNGWCSLNPNEDRPCLAVHLWIDEAGKPLRHQFVRGIMRSAARLTYEQAQAAHDGKADKITRPLLKTVIEPLFGAYDALVRGREMRGVLELDLPERKVRIDADGNVAGIDVAVRYDSHRLIEEFMIAANVAAAETLTKKKKPCMFRVHDAPGAEKLESLRQVLDGIGLKLPRGQVIKPAAFNELLGRVADTPEAPLVNEMILRTQAQAEYNPDNIGHFGLALHKYCHFTSPIRRYADLLVHRALMTACKLGDDGLGDNPPDFTQAGVHVSMTERRAAAAERDAVDRFMAAWLASSEGAVFAGRIVGVHRAGLFVRLNETGADGLIPKRNLPRDTYIHDERRQILCGKHSRKEYRLGDVAEVMLAEATPISGGLIFHLLEGAASEPWRKRRKRNRKNRS
ncbi:MAG: ribonuclease R [Rhodospirillales bacterium]|nr:ribonuclease R [Rhodospirillales bacterium]